MNLYRLNKVIFSFIVLIFISKSLLGWGFFAHRMINGKAVYALPTELFSIYKSNIDYLKEHAVDPDKRRYAIKDEGPRHYIDLDHYLVLGNKDFFKKIKGKIPLRWDSAVSKYSQDTLNEYGIIPWHLNLMVIRLTNAFKGKDIEAIMKLSAEIGHYASDAHVPLHTTENYNGQLTGQKGIHALWESRIPERKAENFSFLLGKAKYLENVQVSIWKVITSSHVEVPFVLKSEKDLRASFDSDKVYRPSTVGRKVSPQYTSAYVEAYSSSNATLVEKRMQEAALFTASLWYTAWVNAGQPNLSAIQMNEIESESKSNDSEQNEDHER